MTKDKKQEDKNGIGYEWEYANKVDTRSTWEKIKSGIYDPSTHAVLGRTLQSWGSILLFYAIFYSALALLFAICMKVLLASLDDKVPRWTEKESLIGGNPGLGFRPMSNHTEVASLIWYQADNDTNVDIWVNDINKFLGKYRNESSAAQKPCNFTYKATGPDDVCKFNLTDLGTCFTHTKETYVNRQPCVFIKLNKIFGWQPTYYENESELPREVPQELRHRIVNSTKLRDKMIWLSCAGETVADKQNIGPIEYYPRQGFPGYYFPYENIDGYDSPLVAVKFISPRRNTLINVECRALAKNIHFKRSSHQREGSVHFELLVD